MSNTINTGTGLPPIYQPGTAAKTDLTPPEGGFGDVLRSAIEQVEQLNSNSEQQVGALLQGDRSDVHNVMIAIEKADVAFQLMMQVRNKIVNAYQQVSQMQF